MGGISGSHGGGEGCLGFWLGVLKGSDHWEGLGVVGRIKFTWTLGRERSMRQTGFGWLGLL
jgi:hypothetical protein